MNILPRSAWGAQPAKSVTWFPAPPVGTVLHYVGSKGALNAATKDRSAGLLRGIQADALNKGYADIEYNFAVDLAGNVWELRGKNVQSGANGDQTQNRKRWSIVFLTGQGEPLSDAAIRSSREMCGWLGGDIVQHIQTASTSCPGTWIIDHWQELVGPTGPIGDTDMTPEQDALLRDVHAWMSQEGKAILPRINFAAELLAGKIDAEGSETVQAIVAAIGALPGGQTLNAGQVATAVADVLSARLQA
ncbi:MAG TPA: N-acetylmuramoyl-L-alanine amidase [Bacteroidia bacterium]|nr:N-acetylmuramoyl-L-alanine amidase [Bacteroidia bacterium]